MSNVIYIGNKKDPKIDRLIHRVNHKLLTGYIQNPIYFIFHDINNLAELDFYFEKQNTFVILHLDEYTCNQLKREKKEHFYLQVQRLINEVPLSRILLVSHISCNQVCSELFFDKVYKNFMYDDIKSLEHQIIDYVLNFLYTRTEDKDLYRDSRRIEVLLEEKEQKIKKLEKSQHTKEEKTKNEIDRLKKEAEDYKTKLTELEAEKQKETDDIEKIITFLAAMPKEISQEQSYLEMRRSRFTAYGGLFLSFSIILAFGLIGNVLFDNKLNLPVIDKVSQYLAYALTVGFPMGISLLFYRQANLKSKEIDKINEKSILVKQVENALNSYNVLLSGEELKIKTISSIDRVIDKVFENNKKENNSEKTEDTKLSISDVQKILKLGTDLTKN